MKKPSIHHSGITNANVMQIDYARQERQAFLQQRFHIKRDWRRCYAAVHCFLFADASLERAMVSFHSTHHVLTWHGLLLKQQLHTVAITILQHGMVAGAKTAWRHKWTEAKHDET